MFLKSVQTWKSFLLYEEKHFLVEVVNSRKAIQKRLVVVGLEPDLFVRISSIANNQYSEKVRWELCNLKKEVIWVRKVAQNWQTGREEITETISADVIKTVFTCPEKNLGGRLFYTCQKKLDVFQRNF